MNNGSGGGGGGCDINGDDAGDDDLERNWPRERHGGTESYTLPCPIPDSQLSFPLTYLDGDKN